MTTPISSRPPLRPAQAPEASTASAPAARTTDVAPQGPVDVFAPAAVSGAGTRPADGLKAYEELSAAQKGLLGANGPQLYAGLSSKQRGVFLLLTPPDQKEQHLQLMKSFASQIRKEHFCEFLHQVNSAQALVDLLTEFEAR